MRNRAVNTPSKYWNTRDILQYFYNFGQSRFALAKRWVYFLHFRGEQSSNFDKMGRVLEMKDRGICIRTKSDKTCLSSVVSSVFGRFVADIVGPKISSSYSSFSWFDSSSRRHGFFHLLRYWTKAVPHTDALRISDPTPRSAHAQRDEHADWQLGRQTTKCTRVKCDGQTRSHSRNVDREPHQVKFDLKRCLWRG